MIWLRGILRSVGRIVNAEPLLLLVLAQAVAILLLAHQRSAARADTERRQKASMQWRGDFFAQRHEMRKLAGLVRAARVEAAKLDAENRRRVSLEWNHRLEAVTDDYQDALSRSRSALDSRLRGDRSATCGAPAPGGGGAAQLPIISTLPEGPLQGGGTAIISRSDALICQANTDRLEALVAAWSAAAKIDVNRAPSGASGLVTQGR